MIRSVRECCTFLFPSKIISSYKSFELPPTSLRDSILLPKSEKNADEMSTQSDLTMNDLSTIDLNDQKRSEMFSPKETPAKKEGGGGGRRKEEESGRENDQVWSSIDAERKEQEGGKKTEDGGRMEEGRTEEGGKREGVEEEEEGGRKKEEERGREILEWNINSMKEILLSELLNDSTLLKYDKIYEDTVGPSKLKVYWKSYLSQNFRINVLRGDFELGCEPEFFIDRLNDYELQLKLTEKHIEENRPLHEFDGRRQEEESWEDAEGVKMRSKTLLMYLKYKKVLTISSRDFVFIKHTELIDPSRSLYIDVGSTPNLPPSSPSSSSPSSSPSSSSHLQSASSSNLPISSFRSPYSSSPFSFPLASLLPSSLILTPKEGVIRGEVILAGSVVEKIEGGCRVKVYSESDLRQSLPQIVMKPAMLMEFKKYVEKMVGVCGAKN